MSNDLYIIQPGLTCDGCSACCMNLVLPPFDDPIDESDPDIERLPPALKAEFFAALEATFNDDGTFRDRSKAGTPCIWLDVEARRCRHYEYRPTACLRFEPGNPSCLESREDYDVRETK